MRIRALLRSRPLPVALACCASLLLYALLWVNFWRPVLRFSSASADTLVFMLALTLPFLAGGLVWRTRKGGARTLLLSLLLPLGLWSLLWLFFSLLDLETILQSGSSRLEPIGAVRVGRSVVRAYRTNGGAMTDFGVLLRQEQEIAAGLLRVQDLDYRYHTYDARLQREGSDRVRVRWIADDSLLPGPELVIREFKVR